MPVPELAHWGFDLGALLSHVPALLYALKGVPPMSVDIQKVKALVADLKPIAVAVTQLVEVFFENADNATKRAQAIEMLTPMIQKLAEQAGLPAVLAEFLVTPELVGKLVDFAVAEAKKLEAAIEPPAAPTPSTASGAPAPEAPVVKPGVIA